MKGYYPLLMWGPICWGLVYAPWQAVGCIVILHLYFWYQAGFVLTNVCLSLPRTNHGHRRSDC